MGLRQKLASVFLPAEPLAPSAFRKLYKRKIPPAYVRRIVPFTCDTRETTSLSSQLN